MRWTASLTLSASSSTSMSSLSIFAMISSNFWTALLYLSSAILCLLNLRLTYGVPRAGRTSSQPREFIPKLRGLAERGITLFIFDLTLDIPIKQLRGDDRLDFDIGDPPHQLSLRGAGDAESPAQRIFRIRDRHHFLVMLDLLF